MSDDERLERKPDLTERVGDARKRKARTNGHLRFRRVLEGEALGRGYCN